MKALLFFFCMMIIPSGVFAGPFGTNMGDSIELYKNRDNKYFSKKIIITEYPPIRHPDFKEYKLYFRKGLCAVSAKSAPFYILSIRDEILDKYNQIKEQLSAKYGSPSLSHEWSVFSSGDSFSSYICGNKHESVWTRLRGEIIEIKLSIKHEDSYNYLIIEYYYSNSGRKSYSVERTDSL